MSGTDFSRSHKSRPTKACPGITCLKDRFCHHKPVSYRGVVFVNPPHGLLEHTLEEVAPPRVSRDTKRGHDLREASKHSIMTLSWSIQASFMCTTQPKVRSWYHETSGIKKCAENASWEVPRRRMCRTSRLAAIACEARTPHKNTNHEHPPPHQHSNRSTLPPYFTYTWLNP